MKKFGLLILLFFFSTILTYSQTPQTLPFTQDWTNTGLITVNDNWTGVSGIIGYLGDDGSSTTTGIDPQTILSGTLGFTVDVVANQTAPNTNTSGGVAEFQITDPVVALQGSGSADFPFIIISINTTGKENIQISYNVRDIDGSADNSIQSVALQYRIGNTGLFTNISGAFIIDATTGPGLATLVTPISLILPSSSNNQGEVQLRIITTNAVGSDEWVGIDDISITGSDIATGTPTITLNTTGFANNFGSIQVGNTSAEQSYQVTGTDLTAGITVTAPSGFEVSLISGSGFGSSVNLPATGGTVYVHFIPGTFGLISGNTTHTSTGATQVNLTVSGTGLKSEATNHVTSFTSILGTPNHSVIDLSWVDAIGATLPDGYLIKASTIGFANIVDPIDGTTESNGTLVKNIAQGVQAASFTGLTANTPYFFKIYPFTNSNSNINYKTDGTIPQTNITTGAAPNLPNAWVNELHYDNSGADQNEFIEIAVQNSANYNITDFLITLYNGSDGSFYGTPRFLSDYIVGILNPDTQIQLYYSLYPTGIQNGSPDGICLSYQGSPILFISYDGSFEATNGVAIGLVSTNIGIIEPSNAPLESSIGLTGTGTTYTQMTWSYFPGSSTTGDVNSGQVLPVELSSFSATTIGKDVKLSWNTSTEVNNYGFEVERSVVKDEWSKIGFVNGNGNSNSPKDYSFVDDKVTTGKYSYRLKQIDNDGQFEYSKVIEIDLNGKKKFELTQNYPNPFNPTTTIQYQLPQTGMVKLTLYNILGQELQTLVNETKEAGTHTVNFDASDLNSGVYVYKIESGSFTQTRKMTLVK